MDEANPIVVKNVLPRRQPPRARPARPRRLVAAALLAGACLASGGADAAGLDLAAPLWAADWRTGLALHGFDPVAYFAQGRALPGSPDFESETAGGTWRFRNEGNMAAFRADPQAYRPRFAGFDPVALARGVARAGNPLIWVIEEGQLLLFFDEAARAAFAKDARGTIAAAERVWLASGAPSVP